MTHTNKYSLNALLLQVLKRLRQVKRATFSEHLKLTGTVNLRVIDNATGLLIEQRTINNLVVDLGKGLVCANISVADPSTIITQIGAGTDNTVVSAGDVALTGGVNIALGAPTYPTGTSVEFPFTFGTGDANGITVQEFGLITTGGVLFSRVVIAPIAKTAAISIVGTWNISL